MSSSPWGVSIATRQINLTVSGGRTSLQMCIHRAIGQELVEIYHHCCFLTNSIIRSFFSIPAKPQFRTADQLAVLDVTSSSMTLRWPKAENVTTGLESHYYYLIRLHAGGETEKTITRLARETDNIFIETQITGLTFNTNYSVTVIPYRQHNEVRESGVGTIVTRFKTSCIGMTIFSVVLINKCLFALHKQLSQ